MNSGPAERLVLLSNPASDEARSLSLFKTVNGGKG